MTHPSITRKHIGARNLTPTIEYERRVITSLKNEANTLSEMMGGAVLAVEKKMGYKPPLVPYPPHTFGQTVDYTLNATSDYIEDIVSHANAEVCHVIDQVRDEIVNHAEYAEKKRKEGDKEKAKREKADAAEAKKELRRQKKADAFRKEQARRLAFDKKVAEALITDTSKLEKFREKVAGSFWKEEVRLKGMNKEVVEDLKKDDPKPNFNTLESQDAPPNGLKIESNENNDLTETLVDTTKQSSSGECKTADDHEQSTCRKKLGSIPTESLGPKIIRFLGFDKKDSNSAKKKDCGDCPARHKSSFPDTEHGCSKDEPVCNPCAPNNIFHFNDDTTIKDIKDDRACSDCPCESKVLASGFSISKHHDPECVSCPSKGTDIGFVIEIHSGSKNRSSNNISLKEKTCVACTSESSALRLPEITNEDGKPSSIEDYTEQSSLNKILQLKGIRSHKFKGMTYSASNIGDPKAATYSTHVSVDDYSCMVFKNSDNNTDLSPPIGYIRLEWSRLSKGPILSVGNPLNASELYHLPRSPKSPRAQFSKYNSNKTKKAEPFFTFTFPPRANTMDPLPSKQFTWRAISESDLASDAQVIELREGNKKDIQGPVVATWKTDNGNNGQQILLYKYPFKEESIPFHDQWIAALLLTSFSATKYGIGGNEDVDV